MIIWCIKSHDHILIFWAHGALFVLYDLLTLTEAVLMRDGLESSKGIAHIDGI